MDPLSVVSILIFLLLIGGMVYLANQVEMARVRTNSVLDLPILPQGPLLRVMLYGMVALTFIFSILVLQFGLLGDTFNTVESAALPPVEPLAAGLNLGIAVLVCQLAVRLVAAPNTRQWLSERLGPSFQAQSAVHLTAAVLLLCITSILFSQLVLAGGVEGIAENISASGISLIELLAQGALLIAIAFLGVGLSIRRDVPSTLGRLGLWMPSSGDMLAGVLGGFGLFILSQLLGLVWVLVTSPEQVAAQGAAAQEIALQFDTLPMAFALALIAAFSEEILFRGALQPVFGNLTISVFFALFHTQYALSPATLIILAVSLGFGAIRQRRNTSTAAVAHFVYNFVPLMLLSAAPQMLTGN